MVGDVSGHRTSHFIGVRENDKFPPLLLMLFEVHRSGKHLVFAIFQTPLPNDLHHITSFDMHCTALQFICKLVVTHFDRLSDQLILRFNHIYGNDTTLEVAMVC